MGIKFRFIITIIVLLSCCITGYATSLGNSNANDSSDKYIWEHQLDYMKGHNKVKGFPLKLLGYKYLGVISNKQDVEKYLDFVFSENSYLAVHSD